MYEVLNIRTTTYMVTQKEGFFVDIQTNDIDKIYDAYLWHKDYGVKMLMFGTSTDKRFKEFFEAIENNLHTYIEIYNDEIIMED